MEDAKILPIELAGLEIDPTTQETQIWEEIPEGFVQDEGFSDTPEGN
jgi:hypothetical protein